MVDRSRDHFTEKHYKADKIHGPVPFLNPTRRHIALSSLEAEQAPGATDAAEPAPGKGAAVPTSQGIYHVWRSRDNRKGRHAVAITDGYVDKAGVKATNTVKEILRGAGRMLVRYPVWDISYDVAMMFTIGSVVWCINGFFVWYPLYRPETEFPNETDLAAGITALIGATIFEVGAALALIESVNENRTDCFGWALEKAVEEGSVMARRRNCRHHHVNRRSLLGLETGERKGLKEEKGGGGGVASGSDGDRKTEDDRSDGKDGDDGKRRWRWWPSWYELRTHYIRDIGFLANAIQMMGATIFWIAGIVGMPGILDVLSGPAEDGIYWLPQVVGGSGFIISSALLMLEVQSKWWQPAPLMLGWHVGFWNFVGGIGFTLCGALGFGSGNESVEYASVLATFVGSWAFLLGSIIQWYESLDKYPVTVKRD